MTTLKCLGSGSSGNAYLIDYNEKTLILECGIKIIEIKKRLWLDKREVIC